MLGGEKGIIMRNHLLKFKFILGLLLLAVAAPLAAAQNRPEKPAAAAAAKSEATPATPAGSPEKPAPPPAPPPTVQAPAPAIPELPASVSPVIPVREPALDAVPQPPGAAPDPQRLRCRENLKTLAAAVQTFAADHGQKLPADFRDLQPYLRTPRCLFCPADASNAPFATDKWDQVDWSKTSYQLMAPGAALAGAPSAILHCRAHKTQATIDGQELVPDNELGPRFRGVTPEMMKRYGLKNVDPEMMKRYGLFIPPTAEAAPPAGKAGAPPRDSTAPTPLPAPVPPPLAAPPGIDPTTGLPVSVPPPPATPPGELQSGLFEEDARLNLDAAIRAYQTVVTQFDSQRTSAAQAVFRLAECYRKLGRTDEAKNLYLRITREFPDQAELARLSQQYLNGALPPAAKPRLTHVVTQVVARDQSAATPSREGPAAVDDPSVASLYQQEAALLADKLAILQQRVNSGTLPSWDLIPVQKELLKVRRQMAGSTAEKLALVEAEKKLLQQSEQILRKRMEVGGASSEGLLPIQRELLALERERLALEKSRPTGAETLPAKSPAADPTPAEPPKTAVLTPKQAEELQRLEEQIRDLDADLVQARQKAAQAREKLEALDDKWREETVFLEALDGLLDVVAAPEPLAKDPRYQKLKEKYEELVLGKADAAQINAQKEKIQTWVTAIYRPELRNQLNFNRTQKVNAQEGIKRAEIQLVELKMQRQRILDVYTAGITNHPGAPGAAKK